MKAWKGEVRPERPVPFGRADAERIGLAVGKKIVYEAYTKKQKKRLKNVCPCGRQEGYGQSGTEALWCSGMQADGKSVFLFIC